MPVSHNPANDARVIEETLEEIELLEQVGVDVAFLSEHHIDGECAYADPLVFSAAVATRTSRIQIGFSVIEMGIHNPVRLAIQLSLIDNLSGGRVIVGTARGTRSKYYEYGAFGTSMEEGLERLEEAEDLLVKIWTTRNLHYKGKYWKVFVPDIRPRPIQKPHPPVLRGCLSESSIISMANVGRPIMLGSASNNTIRHRLKIFKETMADSGFSEEKITLISDQNWVAKVVMVADSEDQAKEVIEKGYRRWRKFQRDMQNRYNPDGFKNEVNLEEDPDAQAFADAAIFGTPDQVTDQIADIRDTGAKNVMFKFNPGELSPIEVHQSIRLFGEKVIPRFK